MIERLRYSSTTSTISLSTKLRLYRVFILLVILYQALWCRNIWSPTRQLARNLDAFDQWCLRRILRISWRNRISNGRPPTYWLLTRLGSGDQPPLTDTIRTTRLKYFGHIARADPSMDHSRALRASVAPLQGTGNVEPADRVTPGFGPSSLTLHLSTLV